MSIRPSRTFPVLGFVTAAFALTGCWGVEEEPTGLAESYRPKYTEAKGTRIQGDWFPLEAGTGALLEGSLSGTLRVSVRGSHLGRAVDIDSNASFAIPMGISMVAQPERPITFPRGTVDATPVVITNAPFSLAKDLPPPGAGSVTAYFTSTDKGVYLLGLGDGKGGVVEAPAPIHLKLPLQVGDSWESTLSHFPDLSFAGITGAVRAHARTFVAGRETVDLGGRKVEALRLEQVADFSISGAAVQGVAVGVKGWFKGVTHLAEGMGQVRQQVFLKASAYGRVTQNGETLSVDASLDLAGDVQAAMQPVAKVSQGGTSGGSTGGSGGLNPMP